jgi:hypothetical protein
MHLDGLLCCATFILCSLHLGMLTFHSTYRHPQATVAMHLLIKPKAGAQEADRLAPGRAIKGWGKRCMECAKVKL